MITIEEKFAAEIAVSLLQASEENVQAETLVVLVTQANRNGTLLKDQLNSAMVSERNAGDFGMEIIGPLIIPILIEAGKELWKLYVKKLGEKAAEKLADLTIEKTKQIALSIWSGNSLISVAEYEKHLRSVAKTQKLDDRQTEVLIQGVRSESMKKFLSKDGDD